MAFHFDSEEYANRLQRLTSRMREEKIDAMLEQRGVGLRSLTESIDTTTAGGRLIFHVFGALAEFERAVIRERTQAGLAAARSRGKIGGRPRKMTENDIRAAKAMLADGDITVGEVAKRLNIAPSTLYKHLPAARTNSGA